MLNSENTATSGCPLRSVWNNQLTSDSALENATENPLGNATDNPQ